MFRLKSVRQSRWIMKSRVRSTQLILHYVIFGRQTGLSNIGRIIVSKAFIDNHADLLTYTYPVDNDYSGVVTAYICSAAAAPWKKNCNSFSWKPAIPVIHLEDSPQTKTILLPVSAQLIKAAQ